MISETAQRINMVKQQLRTGGVLNEAILKSYEEIPRHAFVPNGWEHFAYADMQIPLTHQERMMTPLEEGQILQALSLKGNETVLEVGTGSGFLTALLSRLCKRVISVDYYAEFTQNAYRKLEAHHCRNVELITGDGCHGWFDKAPFDVILFTSAMERINKSLTLQLSSQGKLFVVLGKKSAMRGQLHTLNSDGQWKVQEVFETNLPPLIDKTAPKKFIF